MKQLLTVLEAQAKQHPQRIVYPESTEPRILKAVYQVAKQGLAHPLLLGKKETILAVARNLGLSDLFLESHVKIINPAEETALREVFAEKLFILFWSLSHHTGFAALFSYLSAESQNRTDIWGFSDLRRDHLGYLGKKFVHQDGIEPSTSCL